MNLDKFTKYDSEIKNKKEILLNNNNIKITKIRKEVEFIFKKKGVIDEFQDFLFFSLTNSKIINTELEAESFFNKSMEEGVEGLMFKNLKSKYKSGLRSGAMAKLKDTNEDLDVVILAAEYGKGRRTGYYSSFFIAVKSYDEINNENKYLEIGKVSSGIKEIDENGLSLKIITELLTPFKINEKKNISYFEPKIILQVKYQEIQKSLIYESGYALRFPRIIMLRKDKDLNEINSIEDIKRFVK